MTGDVDHRTRKGWTVRLIEGRREDQRMEGGRMREREVERKKGGRKGRREDGRLGKRELS